MKRWIPKGRRSLRAAIGMKRIDAHHHLIEEHGYVDRLLRAMDRLSIEASSLLGVGLLFQGLFVKANRNAGMVADNDAVEQVCKAHPDRFFGLGFVRLGVDGPDRVTELHERGFKGIKFHVPKDRYDAEAFFPVYQQVETLKLPALFHTGVLRLPSPAPGEQVSSFNMDCIHLERIAQEFPALRIIIAHLGVQSYLTALTMVRMFPNIYADLSGSTPGWRANIAMDDWKRLLWFPEASQKLLFGSDVHESELDDSIRIYDDIASAAGWGAEERQALYYGNAQRLFVLKPAEGSG